MSEIGVHPVALNSSPARPHESVFLQPRRFPEYLRLQNIRDRVDDVVTIHAGDQSTARPVDQPCDADRVTRDATLPKIGDVLPVDPSHAQADEASAQAPQRPASTAAIDGLGRLIDAIA